MENRLGELESSPDYSQYPAPYIRHGRGDLLHSGDPFLNTSLPSCRYGEESSSQSPEDLLTPEQYAPGRSAAIPPSIHLLRGRDGIGYPSSGHLLGEIPMSSTASSVSAEEGMTPVFQGSMLSGSSAVRRIPRSLPYEGDRPESQDERLLVKPHETTADAQADAKDLPRPTIGAPNTIAGNIDASPASNVAEGILEPAIAEVHVHFALASSSQTIEIQPATPPTSRGNLLCPYVGCPRANPGNGFVRGDNLRTHRRTVHGEDIPRIRYPRRIG
ncbi:hypothetical protein BJ508DRAFT_119109 [Ascobolus immersus RN42]|uniref:C2H2-domain containing protein second zinc finger domain-containing protein n=1 Tax=Ascobolus immersus RN42 TaxID=1160509 RepID=A0A3N4IPM6_ASCIM|nr:hypothetical protein BJ508DRAFT_119109 [Ascobolus immersus RN42]